MRTKSFAVAVGVIALSMVFTAFAQAKSVSPKENSAVSAAPLAVNSDRAITGPKITKNVCGGAVADSDGNSYGTVMVGSQCWMATNLRTTTNPNGTCINGGGTSPCPAQVAYADSNRVCPDMGFGPDCSQGAMYRWNAMMNGSATPGAQGICPAGFHVPTTAEFSTLSSYLVNSATSEYIRWPAGIGHRVRYHLNGQAGTVLPYATTAEEALARYNFTDPNYKMFDMPLSGFGLFGIESGDEFTDIETVSHLASSNSAGSGLVNSYMTAIDIDNQTGIPTGYSTASLSVNDAREALPLRCIKN